MIQPVTPSLLTLPGGRAAPRAPGEGAVFALPAEGEPGAILLTASGSDDGSRGWHDDAAPGNALPTASVTALTPSALPSPASVLSSPPTMAVSTPVLPATPIAPRPITAGDERPRPGQPIPSDQPAVPAPSPTITAPAASRTTPILAEQRSAVASAAASPPPALATGTPEAVAAPAPPGPAPSIDVAAHSSSSPMATPSVPDATQASSAAPAPAPRIAALPPPSEQPDDIRPTTAETTSPAMISVPRRFSATWPNRAAPSPDSLKDDEAAEESTSAIETAWPPAAAAPTPAVVVAAHPTDPPLGPNIAATERKTLDMSPAPSPSRAGMTAAASPAALSAGWETAIPRSASPAIPVTSPVTTASGVTTAAPEHAATLTPPTDPSAMEAPTRTVAPPALPASGASLAATTSRAAGGSPAVAMTPPSTVISVPRRFASTWPTPLVAPDAIAPRSLPPVVATAGITVPAPAAQIAAPSLPAEPLQSATVPADLAPGERSAAPVTGPAATAAAPGPVSSPIPTAAPAGIVFGAARFAAQTADDRDEPMLPLGLAPLAAPAMERAVATPLPQPPLDVTQERWPHAMIERIEMIRDAANEVDTRIRLVPDALGAIDVDVRRDGDTLHVRFQADQPQTRALLADAAPRLAEAAEARGLRLGQSSVGGGQGDGAAGHGQQQRPSLPAAPPRVPVSSTAAGPADDDDIRLA